MSVVENIKYTLTKVNNLTVLVAKVGHIDEVNYGEVAELLIEKLKSRNYRYVILMVNRDVKRELVNSLVDLLQELGVTVSVAFL